LSARYVGRLEQVWGSVVRANTETAAGVFLELEQERCILAAFDNGLPQLPLAPSISILWHFGSRLQVEGAAKPRWQMLWLLQEGLPAKQRAVLEERLVQIFGATPAVKGAPHLVRLPGTYCRRGEPFMVEARGSAESQGSEVGRYSPAEIATYFMLNRPHDWYQAHALGLRPE
jgi:hypothetical protein